MNVLDGNDHDNELKEEKLRAIRHKEFLKWFRVKFPSTSTVMKFPLTMRKRLHTQSQIWQSFGKIKVSLGHWGALPYL